MKTFEFFVLVLLFIICIILLISTISGFFAKVPFVSSKKRVLKKMIETANLKQNQKIYDLGCGDGRFLFYAEKKSKTIGIGYEIALLPYLLAQTKKIFFNYKSKVFLKNFMTADISDADVIFCYLFPVIVVQVMEKAKKECKSGTLVISNTFKAEGFVPYQIYEKNKENHLPNIYVYKI